jgi:type II secretory pathway pseudopilin PulG
MKRRRGFANPEYLITLTVVGLILAVAVPKFVKARERSRNFKALRELRTALGAYRADHKGASPAALEELTEGGKYLAAIPSVRVSPLHSVSAWVNVAVDAGGWWYEASTDSARSGDVWINGTHTDDKGSSWSAY